MASVNNSGSFLNQTSTTTTNYSLFPSFSAPASISTSLPPGIADRIHTWNVLVTGVLGTALNVTLLCLIVWRTPAEMLPYGKILLQTTLTDLAMLAVNSVTRMVFFASDGSGQIILLNETSLEKPWNNLFVVVLGSFFIFPVVGCASQFINRYLILCKNRHGHYWSLLAGAVGVSGCFGVWHSLAGYPFGDEKQPMLENEAVAQLLDIDLQREQVFLFSVQKTNPWYKAWLGATTLLTLFAYTVIGYLGRQMVLYVRANLMNQSNSRSAQRTNRVNQQLTKTLIIQAILPLFAFTPLLFAISMVAFSVKGEKVPAGLLFAELLCSALLNWLPVANSIVTMTLIHPYRDTIVAVVSLAVRGKNPTKIKRISTHIFASEKRRKTVMARISSASVADAKNTDATKPKSNQRRATFAFKMHEGRRVQNEQAPSNNNGGHESSNNNSSTGGGNSSFPLTTGTTTTSTSSATTNDSSETATSITTVASSMNTTEATAPPPSFASTPPPLPHPQKVTRTPRVSFTSSPGGEAKKQQQASATNHNPDQRTPSALGSGADPVNSCRSMENEAEDVVTIASNPDGGNGGGHETKAAAEAVENVQFKL